MRNPHGTAIIVDPNAPVRELDTITCAHCQRIVFIKPGLVRQGFDAGSPDNPDTEHDPGGFCRVCMSPVCGPCCDDGRCVPFEVKLLKMEGRKAFLRGVEFLG